LEESKNQSMNAGREFATSIFLASSSSGLAKIINLISLLVLARLLNPSSFGLVAIALLFINSLSLLSNFGFRSALIQKQDRIETAANAVFFITPLINILLYIVAFSFSGMVGNFFNNDQVPLIIKILSLSMILQSFAVVQSSLLEKKLDYKKLMIPETFASLAYLLVTVVLAILGFGVWSLVIGQLARNGTSGFLLWRVSQWRPSNFKINWEVTKQLSNYGKHIVLLGIISFIIKNLDNAVIAKYLTPTDLGYYTMAYTLGNLLPLFIKNTLSRVVFPLYSSLNQELVSFKEKFLLINRTNMIFCVWVTILLIAVFPKVILYCLGQKWSSILPMIQVLAIFGFQRSIGSVISAALNALGKPQYQREPMIINSLIFIPLVIPVTIKFGALGVAYLATISIIPGFLWTMFRTFKLVGIKKKEYLPFDNFFRSYVHFRKRSF
jgi:O-antigen/teichoic acid export membrane protein